MLQIHTVEPGTLALLKNLMSCDALQDYNLVGGTSLSLQLGHRKSIDLNLFGKTSIDFEALLSECKKFGEVEVLRDVEPIYQIIVNNIKVDIVKYPYDLLEPLLIVDSIRLVSTKDIAAMKITAIGTRATKKDFYDLFFLLKKYQIAEIINFCELKFPGKDFYHYIKSLTYFDEVDEDQSQIELLNSTASWDEVKRSIANEVSKFRRKHF